MKEGEVFFDTNILLYVLSSDESKADRAEEVIAHGGIVSVQVLNEFANVAIRKLGMTWVEVHDFLSHFRAVCSVIPNTVEVHERGLLLAERYGFSVYDSMMLASALLGNCTVLYSEDMQNGRRIDGQLTLRNPFVTS